MSSAGYSGTPLGKKLGLQTGHRVALFNAPEGFQKYLGDLPGSCQLLRRPRQTVDIVIVFSLTAKQLSDVKKYPKLMHAETAMWLTWPKKSSQLQSDLDFSSVQAAGLALGLVDNKICAIDHDWSALRFVVPVKDRSGWREA